MIRFNFVECYICGSIPFISGSIPVVDQRLNTASVSKENSDLTIEIPTTVKNYVTCIQCGQSLEVGDLRNAEYDWMKSQYNQLIEAWDKHLRAQEEKQNMPNNFHKEKTKRKVIKDAIVISSNPNLITYFKELGLIDDTTPVLTKTTSETIYNKNVIGDLPFELSILCKSITFIKFSLPEEKSLQNLSLEEIRMYALEPVTIINNSLNPSHTYDKN